MVRVIAFDVNETLLDLSSLDGCSSERSATPPCAASGSPRCCSSPSSAG